MNKKWLSAATLSTVLIPALLCVTSAASAYTWTFNDPCTGDAYCNTSLTNPYTAQYAGPALYYGGDGANFGGDTVGDPGQYDILNLTAEIDATDLTVSVLTRFVEDTGTSNVLYGDLMLSTLGYSPYTDGGNYPSPYIYDTATNTGTVWNYVVSTSTAGITDTGTGGPFTGTATIYKNPATLILADAAPHDGSTYRADQYVLYGSGGTPTANVAVTIARQEIPDAFDGDTPTNGTLITYKIPLSDIELVGGLPLEQSGVAMRWAMTCANDIVEAYAVAEPETLLLFLGGLLGLVLVPRLKTTAKTER